jgi:hypothetical protein
MARTYLVFGDIEGKLDVLHVECTRCLRKGRYSVAKLIETHGRGGNTEAKNSPSYLSRQPPKASS